jgi:hypothetical protein
MGGRDAPAMMLALRLVGIAIAVVALIDPSCRVQRGAPVQVQVHTDGTPAAETALASARQELPEHVRLGTFTDPDAALVAGDIVPQETLRAGIPVSAILTTETPNVRIVADLRAERLVVGQSATIRVRLDGEGVAGGRSRIVLQQSGVELASREHRWDADRRVTLDFPYVPPGAGAHALRVLAQPVAGETQLDDNAADVVIRVDARRLQILVYECRPSWAAGFVRRLLEDDPAFAVSSLQRSSRGIVTRSGSPPRAFDAAQLESFDLIAVGAPEDLTEREVAALEGFARQRGGTVAFLPDRTPTGPYVRLLGTPSFREVLADRPMRLVTEGGTAFPASELLVPRAADPPGAVLATTEARAPVVLSWALGDGRVLFSGALDAWRYRSEDRGAFRRFWTRTVSAAALASPRELDVRVDRGIVAPSTPVRIEAKVRRTAFTLNADGTRLDVPPVSAEVIDPDGRGSAVRLWPGSTPGAFEGLVEALTPGTYTARVRLEDGEPAETEFTVDPRASRSREADPGLVQVVASATGGISTSASDPAPVIRHLANLRAGEETVVVHPLRSPWWIVPFAAALCAEWALRRKRGLR